MREVLEQNEKMKALVERARRNDNEAWEELYKVVSGSVMFTIKQFIKDEAQAEDIFQDTLLNAYSKIDTLLKPEQFKSWIVTSAANRAKDYLKKKNQPVLFNELENEDFDEPIDFEDENLTFQPEANMDMAETVRLINEMLEQLPQNQQIALALHYGDHMSASKIAEIMECSVNTAKGYLKYGLQNLQKQKDEMEKKGIKLRGIAMVPFLSWKFGEEMEAMAMPSESVVTLLAAAQATEGAAAGVEMAVTSGEISGAASTVTATAGATGAGTAGTAIGGIGISKAFIGLAAAVVIGGGSFAGYGYYQNQQKKAQAAEWTAEADGRLNEGNYEEAIKLYQDALSLGLSDMEEIEHKLENAEDIKVQEEHKVQINDTMLAEINLIDPMAEDGLIQVSDLMNSDLGKEYMEINETDVIWVPSDTGENVTGYYKNGGIYKGTADGGVRTGQGTWRFEDQTYVGNWVNDKPNGRGVLTKVFPNGVSEIINASFEEGVAEGAVSYSLGNAGDWEITCVQGVPQEIEMPESIRQGFERANPGHFQKGYYPVAKKNNGTQWWSMEKGTVFLVNGL